MPAARRKPAPQDEVHEQSVDDKAPAKPPKRKTPAKRAPRKRAAKKPATPKIVLKADDRAPDERRVLHVGCGKKRQDGMPGAFANPDAWREVRLDIDEACEPDIVANLTDLSAVADGAVDAVFSSHNIEHLFAHEVPTALKEFIRVLDPETGYAVITCPDLQSLGEALASGGVNDALYTSPAGPIAPLDILYGHRASVARGSAFMAHKTGFTAQLLVDLMRACGFAGAIALRHPRTYALWAVGFRWAATKEEVARYAAAFFPRT
ncbi:MAG: methyltransferase domain-containing protein [Pseudomonadota bacterium]